MTLDLSIDAPVLMTEDGEDAKYRRDGHPARPITVVVRRMPPQPAADGKPMRGRDVMHVLVLNNNQTGIASDEIDPGRDKLEVAPRPGLRAVVKTITQIVGVDRGTMILEVQ